jgi:hypothetical protein
MSFFLNAECNALARDDAYFDPDALSACARLTDVIGNSVIFPCVVAVRNRIYAPSQVQFCDQIEDEVQTLVCFRTTGFPKLPFSGSVVAVGEVNQVIDFSLGALNAFQVDSAKDALSSLRQRLSSAASISCQ